MSVKVFISSLITGSEPLRGAAAAAARSLGHEVIRAEDFGASPSSPQQACLAAVRAADIVVLVLGQRYGAVQQSGRSATHEEYLDARESRPVLAFIEADIDPDPDQARFIAEVQAWERGRFTEGFRSASDLQASVTQALHRYELSIQVGPVDEAGLVERARSLLPASQSFGGAHLTLAVASGPVQPILRPASIEGSDLHRFLTAEALTGSDAVLTIGSGTSVVVRDDTVRLTQDRGGAEVTLDETGSLVITQPASGNGAWGDGIPSIIEEDIASALGRALRFCGHVLDHIDSTHRITDVAVVSGLTGSGYLPWRTREEQIRNPNRATMSSSGGDVVATLSPPVRRRSALLQDTARLAEDLTVRLRRGVQG